MSECILTRRGGGGVGKLFAAIGVTYPEGSTCTCTDGVKSFTAKDTSGKCVFAIPYAATWTVTATDGSETDTKTVEITTQGQSVTVELAYIPPGALYWRGKKLAEFTAYAVKPSGDYTGAVLPTITENAESITFSATGTELKGGSVMLPKYDLTNYTLLRAKLESPLQSKRKYMFVTTKENGSGFAINTSGSTGLGSNSYFPALIFFGGTEAGEITLDLSGINGEYYIGFGLAYNSSPSTGAMPPVTITISELQLS